MLADNKAVVQRWFDEVWNQGRAEAIDDLLGEAVLAHGLTDEKGETVRGIDGFKTFHAAFRAAFPDITITVHDMVAEGDKVVAYCEVTATHGGDGLGFKATGKPVHINGMTISRIEDGKIVEAWNSFDFLKLYQQIGLV